MNNDKFVLISYYLKRLYERGLTTCYGGNISIRDGDSYLISETSIDKAIINEKNISRMSFSGSCLNGILPSSEYKMHSSVYKEREDISAIIHAHPPYATAYALSGQSLDSRISSETYRNLGIIYTAKYAQPGSDALAEIVGQAVKTHNSIIMSNHGVIVCANNVGQAYYMIELIENLAQMTYITKLIGEGKQITEQELKLLGGI